MCSKRLTKRSVSNEELAFNYFLSAKKSEGLRAPTIKSYEEHYPDVMLVVELTSPIIRKYLVYMKEDHFNYKTKTNDLSIQTVNARLRFLMR